MSLSLRRGLSLTDLHTHAARPDPAMRLALRRHMALYQPGLITSTAAPWTLSTGSTAAPGSPHEDLTQFHTADSPAIAGFGGGALYSDFFGTYSRQFPSVTQDLTGTGAQLGDGTQAKLWSIGLETNSPRIAFRVDGGFDILSRLRFFVNGALVTLAEPTAASPGRRWLNLTLGAGTHRVTMQGYSDTRFLGLSTLPGASVTPLQPNLRAFVLGDSFSEGGGLTHVWQGMGAQIAEQFGIDDLWISSIGGTGFLPSGGTDPSFGARVAQDLTRCLNSGPVDLILVSGGTNDLDRAGDLSLAATDVLSQIKTLAPDAYIAILGPPDTDAPAAARVEWHDAQTDLQSVADEQGAGFIDLSGVAFSKVDGFHPDAAGAEVLASAISTSLSTILPSV